MISNRLSPRSISARLRIALVVGAFTFLGGAFASLLLTLVRPEHQPMAVAGVGLAFGLGLLAFAISWWMVRDFDVRLRSLAVGLSNLAKQAAPEGSRANRDEQNDPNPIMGTLLNAEADLQTAARALVSIQVERAHSQSLLEQKNSERRIFFSRLSHELRSPLNAILGYTSILTEDAEEVGSESMVHDLSRVRAAGHELLGLIDDLLGMVEDRTGEATRERVPFSLNATVDAIAKDIKTRGNGPRIERDDAATECDITVFGNRALTSRAALGIFDHALKYQRAESMQYSITMSDDCTARVSLVTKNKSKHPPRDSQNEQSVSLEVKDALAKQIGGNLLMSYSSNNTTTYQLDIPVDLGAMRQLENKQKLGETNVTQEEAKPNGHRRKALVVDDDPAAIDLLGRWLKRCDYVVVSASDAAEGLAKAAIESPDLILLDALMPGKSGYDVLPELRALPGMQETPILIVTVDDDRVRGLEAGASDFIRKPVTEGELRNLISVYEDDEQGSVLIIDDDDDAADLLGRTVRRLGFDARRATDGESGLEAVRIDPPRAILLDLNMPNLNGFQFIEALSREGKFDEIPIIVVSAQRLSVAEHHTLVSAGAKFYLKGNAAPREIAAGLREAVA
ncbi:response regulator [Erythrobacter alti]|uniref:response regulator n=1 Tax=Erythrobacter alti TaxID=1896145 RepID=UPI0030F3D929